jgi:hypothetical protein
MGTNTVTPEQARLDHSAQAEVERAAIKRFDEPGSQWGGEDCKLILRDLFPRLLALARKRQSADVTVSEYQDEIDDNFLILNELREAFSGKVNRTLYDLVQDDLWVWPSDKELLWLPFDKWRHNLSPADTTRLANALSSYVERPWLQHNLIDGAAINAFLFSAMSSALELPRMGAFGRTDWAYMLRKFGSRMHPVLILLFGLFIGWIVVPFLKWITVPAIAASLMLLGYHMAAEVTFGLWVSFVIYGLVTLKGRRKRKRDAEATTSAMRMAWEHSCGEVINPARLRELVLDAEQKGAIDYPPVLHTLIERAIQRDLSWSRLSEQLFRVDKWSVCRG